MRTNAASSQVVDRNRFFATMAAFPTGVTVVTTLDEEGVPQGLTCNAFASVSAEPPLLLVSIDKRSNTLPALLHTRRFAVNFLAAGRGALSDRFASKITDKFDGVAWQPAANGMPVLVADAIAYAACSVSQVVEAGDHLIFIGLVEEVSPPSPESQPLVYFRRQYDPWTTSAAT